MGASAEFSREIETVRRLLRVAARRHCMSRDETEEFGSWAIVRVLDNGCRILRRFEGNASLETYLYVVVANLLRDYRIHKWGRWEASVAAKRLGREALLLEQLVVRDRVPPGQAFVMLRDNHGVELSDEELDELLAQLPTRTGKLRAAEVDLDGARFAGGPSPEESVRLTERAAITERANDALARAIASLEPADRALLRMRFDDGFSVAEIARSTGLEQKPLYPRFQRIFRVLRAALEKAGCSRNQVERIWGWRGHDLRVVYDGEEEATKAPSASVQRGSESGAPGWQS